jgi:hypothetical protein
MLLQQRIITPIHRKPTPATVPDDLLLPKCLETTFIPTGTLPYFSFPKPIEQTAGDDDSEAFTVIPSPDNFNISPYLFEILT